MIEDMILEFIKKLLQKQVDKKKQYIIRLRWEKDQLEKYLQHMRREKK